MWNVDYAEIHGFWLKKDVFLPLDPDSGMKTKDQFY